MAFFEYQEGCISQRETKVNITENISFSLSSGETLAIIGQTGSGKTLTALSIMGLLAGNLSFSGEIKKNGEAITEKERRGMLGKEIVYIPQNGHEFLNPSLRVRTQLKDTLRRVGNKDKNAWQELLSRAGFLNPKEIGSMYPFELSGGMAQRVTIALSLAASPELVLADEATNGLNYEDSKKFISSLKEMFSDSARIVITHDLHVAELCDSILVLYQGHIVEYGKAAEVMQSTHLYLESLRNSRVENGMSISEVYREERP